MYIGTYLHPYIQKYLCTYRIHAIVQSIEGALIQNLKTAVLNSMKASYFTSEDTASCLLGRLDTHQDASLCGQLEFVSKTSLIGFESRVFSAARPSGVFVERPRSLEQQSASICGGLPAWGKKK